jgi:hypothetical protein
MREAAAFNHATLLRTIDIEKAMKPDFKRNPDMHNTLPVFGSSSKQPVVP